MRTIVLAAALCLAGAAHCQTLYQCDRGGIHSYQQFPCPPDSRMVRAISVAPEPPLSDVERQRRIVKAEQDRAESAFLSHQAGMDQAAVSRRSASYRASRARTPGGSLGDSRCQAAKDASSAARQAMGLGRTYDALRRLDENVRTACGRG